MDSLQPLFTHIEILVAKDSQLTPVDLKGICTALKVSVALGQNVIRSRRAFRQNLLKKKAVYFVSDVLFALLLFGSI